MSNAPATTHAIAVPAYTTRRHIPGWVFAVLGAAVVGVALVIIVLGHLPRLAVGGLGVAMLMLLLAVGLPIGYATILASAVGLMGLGSYSIAESSVTNVIFDSVASSSSPACCPASCSRASSRRPRRPRSACSSP